MTSPSKGSLRWRGNPASKGHPGLSEDGTCREETLNPLLCPQTHFSVGCDYLGSYFVTASQCPYKEGSLTVRNKALGGSPAGSDSKESPCNAEDCLSSQLEICFLFQEINACSLGSDCSSGIFQCETCAPTQGLVCSRSSISRHSNY